MRYDKKGSYIIYLFICINSFDHLFMCINLFILFIYISVFSMLNSLVTFTDLDKIKLYKIRDNDLDIISDGQQEAVLRDY